MPLFFSLFLGTFLFDLVTKMLVRAKIPFGTEIPILPVFSLVHVTNSGIAFGLFQGRNLFFIGLGICVMAGMIFYATRLYKEDRFSALVLAMVLGGALGNLYDRVRYGEVTDFLDFYWKNHHWPAFNVADSAVCVGATLLIICSLRGPRTSQ